MDCRFEIALKHTIAMNVTKSLHLSLQSLTDLLATAEDDQQSLSAARYLSEQERKTRLEEIAEDRKAWRMDAVRDAMQVVPDDLQTEVCYSFRGVSVTER